jgi:hypothetical protein
MRGLKMNSTIRIILGGLGVGVLTALPWIFKGSWLIGWAAVALLVVWTVWLVYEYLTWARGFKRQEDTPRSGRSLKE